MSNSHAGSDEIENPYLGLRSQVLSLTSEDLGISRESFPHDVWGLVMETGMENGSYTLVVLSDGTTSIYYSSGGGVIGAGVHDKVQDASKILISGANHFANKAEMIDKFPLPDDGQTCFYFLGYDGVKKYSALEQSLGENEDVLSSLFYAAHDVIGTIRETEEK